MATEMFPSNGCCTVARLENCYLAMGLNATMCCNGNPRLNNDNENSHTTFYAGRERQIILRVNNNNKLILLKKKKLLNSSFLNPYANDQELL
jgi:hypothetical protein